MAKSISSLNVGDKIKYGNYQVESETALPIIWNIADKNHTGYPANSVTLVTNKIMDLRGFDGMEAGNADSNRASYGSNRYRTSNLRQWLNSGGLASAWFTVQNLTDGTTNTNNHDASPIDANFNVTTGYATKKGFLNYFSANEQSKILPTTLITAKNTVTDGGSSESVTDNIFLLSTTEVGLANENSIAEGSLLSLFGTASNRISYLTQQAFTNSRSSSKPSTVGTAWYWWLRTPNSTSSYLSRNVSADGSLNYSSACSGGYGVRPALNLSSGILVSDTTDVDGCYTVQWDAHIEFTTNPIQTSMASKKIVFSGIIQFLEGSTLNIYACNNGFDTVPTWEEITTEYLNKQTHTFTNTVKTATNWGISTKIYLKP